MAAAILSAKVPAGDVHAPTRIDDAEVQTMLRAGQRWLRRKSRARRVRHLYPNGSNLSLLFLAYQQSDRDAQIRFGHKARSTRWFRRCFRRNLHALFEQDVIWRHRQLDWRLPLPKAMPLDRSLPPAVVTALSSVDEDEQALVRSYITGQKEQSAPSLVLGEPTNSAAQKQLKRGLRSFRHALSHYFFEHPQAVLVTHPQFVRFTESPYATRQSHPLLSFLIVRVPIQLIALLGILLGLAYTYAYYRFNDEVLAEFLSETISSEIDGDLTFGRVHWSPSLILDLFIGKPHTVEINDVWVYEPYKYHRRDKDADQIDRKATAYAQRLDADLVLHEIVPWNRIGAPKVFDIPWILHFSELRSYGEFWVGARQYFDPYADRYRISLVDAFDPANDLPYTEGRKTLSFQIDRTRFRRLKVPLDFLDAGEWGASLDLYDADLQLSFRGDYPNAPIPEDLPLRYYLRAAGGFGEFVMLDERFNVSHIQSLELGAGLPGFALGDLSVHMDATIEGARCSLDGGLQDVFKDKIKSRVHLDCKEPSSLLAKITPPDAEGRRILDATPEGRVSLHILGDLDSPRLHILGEKLRLDPQMRPEWRIEDASVRATLYQSAVSPHFEADLGEASRREDHWILSLDDLRGHWLGGQLQLDLGSARNEFVLPNLHDPYLWTSGVAFRDIDAALLPPFPLETQGILNGRADAKLRIEHLVFGSLQPDPNAKPLRQRFGDIWPAREAPLPPKAKAETKKTPADPPEPAPEADELRRMVLDIQSFDLRRSPPPGSAPLPRQMSFQGPVLWHLQEGLSFPGNELQLPGARLAVDVALDPHLERIQRGVLGVEVNQGQDFFAAFGLPTFAQSFNLDLSATGGLLRLSGPKGRFSTPGIKLGELPVTGLQDAELQLKDGVLSLFAPKLNMLGGEGPLRASLDLGDRRATALTPRLAGNVKLQSLGQENLLGLPISFEGGQVELILDDGAGGRLPFDALRARGQAFVPRLTMAKVDYHNAHASFVLTPEGIELDHLGLRYARKVSPSVAPNIKVQTGYFSLQGSLGLQSDPKLDLQVSAQGIPLRSLTNFGELDLPVRGTIGRGSALRLNGSAGRPIVEGKVRLSSVNAANLSLGRGELAFSSNERKIGRGSRKQTIREVTLKGSLDEPGRRRSGLKIDATMAFGRNTQGKNEIEFDGNMRFTMVPIRRLLALPRQGRWEREITGSLRGLSMTASYCPSKRGMLEVCRERIPSYDPRSAESLKKQALALDLKLERAWVGTRQAQRKAQKRARARPASGIHHLADNPDCPPGAQLCTLNELSARVDGNRLRLQKPWRILSRQGSRSAALKLQGEFDVSAPQPTATPPRCKDFPAKVRASFAPRPTFASNARATISGDLELQGLDPILLPLGYGQLEGRLNLELELLGSLRQPWVEGRIESQRRRGALIWSADSSEDDDQRPLQAFIPRFEMDLKGSVAAIRSDLQVLNGQLSLGNFQNGVTGVGLSRGCQGRYALHARPNSIVDARLLKLAFPDDIEQSSGTLGIDRFSMRGQLSGGDFRAASPDFDLFQTRLRFDGHRSDFSLAEQDFSIVSGVVDMRLCPEGSVCGRGPGGILVNIGGINQSGGSRQPPKALGIRSVGPKDLSYIWGEVRLPASLDDIYLAELGLALRKFPYRQNDNAGRPELTALFSSEYLRLILQPGGYRQLSGRIDVDEARWLRDASQGVRSVVSFADPVSAPPSTLPASLAGLELDLDLNTTTPFRVDNNILRELEAQAQLHMGGTLAEMEVTGQIDVRRGVFDLALLGGAYNIDRGRVKLDRRISDSRVALSATRQAPVRINNELHQVSLELDGSLDAIQWRCHSTAQRNDDTQTLRGCIDYLIFDAGNTALAPDQSIDQGTVALTRRSLTLFGNLTQTELNRYVEDELPRVGAMLPIIRGRIQQLGLELQIQTRESWFSWRWGRMSLGYSYLRGYSGSFLRDSQSVTSRLTLLDNAALELSFGLRNYNNVALVLEPPRFGSLELVHRFEVPGF